MELRSRVKRLRELLISAGMYEEDMELEEMRQVAQAIESSTSAYNGIENSNTDRALMEGEIDFETTVNSTMIMHPTIPSLSIDVSVEAAGFDDDDSPCTSPVHMLVKAVVHHEQDWSPPTASYPIRGKTSEDDYCLKRTTSRAVLAEDSFDPVANPSHLVQTQVDAVVHHEQNWSPTSASYPIMGKTSENDYCLKRPTSRIAVAEDSFDPGATPISIANSDSGVSCEVPDTLSSISDTSTLPTIGEVPSGLLISTSSAAVSDQSEQEEHDLDFEEEISH